MMRVHELLAGRTLIRETELADNPGPGSSTPLATMAASGITPVDQEFALSRLKPLRRLRHLDQGAIKD
jgi:hypothetical protein